MLDQEGYIGALGFCRTGEKIWEELTDGKDGPVGGHGLEEYAVSGADEGDLGLKLAGLVWGCGRGG